MTTMSLSTGLVDVTRPALVGARKFFTAMSKTKKMPPNGSRDRY